MKGRKDRKSLLQDSDEINQIGPTKQKQKCSLGIFNPG